MKKKLGVLLIFASTYLTSNENTSLIRIQDEQLIVELAQTPEKRQIGLMGRDSLEKGHGMLFVFDTPQILNFWMKNTSIPLSIAFFDTDQRLINIEDMSPTKSISPVIYNSLKPARYALEVPQGWFKDHHIQQGCRFEWSNPQK